MIVRKKLKKFSERDTQLQQVEDCMERESRMIPWQANSIADIDSYLTKGGFLSDKQADLLDNIWNHCTKKG